jgi:hypothetical protein
VSTSELPRINAPVGTAGCLPPSPEPGHFVNGASPWSAAAPPKVVEHFLAGNDNEAWRAWKKHLARRVSPFAATRLAKTSTAEFLLWGCSVAQADDATRMAIASLFEKGPSAGEARRIVMETVMTNGGGGVDEQAALLHVACAYALPELAAELPQLQWWGLLERLCGTARDAAVLHLTSAPLLHQWLAGELPMVLAVLFPELSASVELRVAGRRALSAGLEELLDGEGTPQWRYLDIHWPLVACWTRARSMTASPAGPCWDDESEAQFPFVVREMLRLAEPRGGSLLAKSPIGRAKTVNRFFTAAVNLSHDKQNNAVLQNLRLKGAKSAEHAKKKCRPTAANHSEWARVAVLRPTWKRSSPQLGIVYGERSFRGELEIDGERLFAGHWPFSVVADGRGRMPVVDWDAICWVSDEDVDYLELETELDEGLKLQRQLCLARKDRFLFVADAVLGATVRQLEHGLRVPLGPHVDAVAAGETREIRLSASGAKALVFPLSLPEWRADRLKGELVAGNGNIELQQAVQGAHLYAPLWIDLDPKRGRKPFTWRQLTVAEERRIVPNDSAVGYRIQFGKKQWLVYRSLTPARNRTVLGHNLSSEFLIARFGRDGGVNALIEVE